MQYLDEVVEMFPEEANNEDTKSAQNRPKIHNADTGIEILFISFDGKTYKSGNKFFMREK